MNNAPDKIMNFIGGELAAPQSGEFIESINPATGEVLALVPDSNKTDLEVAVRSAKAAFPEWRDMGAEQRAEIMYNLADLLDKNIENLIEAEVNDNGMSRSFATNVEVPRGGANFRAFADAALEYCGDEFFANDIAEGYIRREPVGVVGTISPWNLPLLLFTWKIAPALAAGNCVIAKPSEITPLTAYLLSTLINDAGFPKGVLNIIHGTGPKIGAAITGHADIARLSFTGSTATGKMIGMSAAQNFKKPPMLEMGGKNPSLVFDDADFDLAVDGVMRAAFSNQGQICLCGSRIYVQQNIYDKFRNALVERTKNIKIGDPLEMETEHGASVSKAHMEKVLNAINLAKSEGGKILCGGERVVLEGRCKNGYFIAPTLVEGVANNSRTNQEEIFGPVATIQSFESEEDAIRLANESTYGLAATIWTQDLDKAMRVANSLETGMPWINCWNLRVLETPFGGMKNSGNAHREGAPDALEFFMEKKTVTSPKRSAA